MIESMVIESIRRDRIRLGLSELAETCHQIAVDKGFWEEHRNFGELVALMHSELSEMLEAHRKSAPDDHLEGAIPGEYVELADLIIRAADLAGHWMSAGIDFPGILIAKLKYNQTRPHKHGKKY